MQYASKAKVRQVAAGVITPSTSTYQTLRVDAGARATMDDEVAVEEPLQIRLAGEDVAVLMRTPGHDDELAAGYVYSEGIIQGRRDIEEIAPCVDDNLDQRNVVNILPADRSLLRPLDWGRLSESYSSCGICGKTSIRQVMRTVPAIRSDLRIDHTVLTSLGEKLRSAQSAFHLTGGLHAAALFDAEGNLQVLREDIGRHNAVDKVIGYALFNGDLPLSNRIMAVTSRASFEIVQKAANAGVPVLAVISAPSSLAVDLARECGMTLVAFLRPGRFNIYSRQDRIQARA
jgi:FdhD protein